jgi:hypothetical protein
MGKPWQILLGVNKHKQGYQYVAANVHDLGPTKKNMHMSILKPCVTCSFANWVCTLVLHIGGYYTSLPLFHN